MIINELKILRKKIEEANLDDPLAEIRAYTDIINQRLSSKPSIRLINLLEKDEQGDLYYNRSFAYEKIAEKCLENNDYTGAKSYYRLASSDTFNASKIYQDSSKIEKCLAQLEEDKEKIKTLPTSKRANAPSPDEYSEIKRSKRGPGMWNSKQNFEINQQKLNDEQTELYSRKKNPRKL